jgi:hypothetical protein
VAFEQARLTTLKAECLAGNRAAIGLLTSAGFHREGTLRSFAAKEGGRTDVVVLGVLATDWPSLRTRLRDRAALALNRISAPEPRSTPSGAAILGST